MDDRVKLEMHAKYIMNKISKQTHLLSRLGKNLSFYTKLLLYKSMIAPQFSFCSTILNGLPDYLIRELQMKQNVCMRIILKCNRYTIVLIIFFEIITVLSKCL